VLWTAGDIKNPGRNIPRALTFGIASVLTAYFIVNAACLWLLGAANAALSRSVASDALAVLHPDAGRWLAAAIGISRSAPPMSF
jgi:APA family basic amino acid/polyamine antiporter